MSHEAPSLPMVLIPGFMLDNTLWQSLTPLLKTHRQIQTLLPTEKNTLKDMAERLLDECPEEFILLGFSMGGYIARAMSTLAPERVKALILVASSLRGDTPEQTHSKTLAIDAIRRGTPFKGMSRSALRASLHPDHATDDMLDLLQKMGVRLGSDVFIRQSQLDRTAFDHAITAIQCPILIIAAENDRLRSMEEAQELQAAFPQAALEIIPHSGHMIPLEQPEMLAKLVSDWIRNLKI